MIDTIAARAAPRELKPSDFLYGTPPKKDEVEAHVRKMVEYRQDFEDRWKEIRDYQLPYLGEFQDTADETNRARRRDLKLANGVAWLACQAFAAGIMSGLTPPSRQWFKLTFSNTRASEDTEAGKILDQRQEIIESILHKSNFYNAIHSCYMELPFGQAPLGVFESERTGVRFSPYTVGTYYLGVGASGRVNTFLRRYKMNACQIQEEFGDKLPRPVKEALENKGQRYSREFYIYWMVRPNARRAPKKEGAHNMAFESLYWLEGQDINDNGGYLHTGGFEEFPVPTARYQVSGMDPYGRGPGWYAEGDSKQLNVMKLDLLTAAELMVKPPLKGPPSLQGINLIPGGYTEVSTANDTVQPLFQVPSNPQWLAQEIVKTEESIKRIYSADLFLMLDSMDTPQMTAREVMERQQEKLQQLGPVVERLQGEFLSPIIERVYNILDRNGIFPPIPQDVMERMAEEEVKIEYISPLAQAQKMSGLVNIEQALAFTGQMSQLYPEALKVVDPMGTIRKYFDLLGAPAQMQRSAEDVEALIEQEQQAMEEQKQQEQAMQFAQAAAPAAQAAKNLTDAANDGNPALQNLMGVTGPGGPAVI